MAAYFPRLQAELERYAAALRRLEELLGTGAFSVPLAEGKSAAEFVREQSAEVVGRWLQNVMPDGATAAASSASDDCGQSTAAGGRMTKAEKQAQKAKRKADKLASRK